MLFEIVHYKNCCSCNGEKYCIINILLHFFTHNECIRKIVFFSTATQRFAITPHERLGKRLNLKHFNDKPLKSLQQYLLRWTKYWNPCSAERFSKVGVLWKCFHQNRKGKPSTCEENKLLFDWNVYNPHSFNPPTISSSHYNLSNLNIHKHHRIATIKKP